MTVSAGGQGRDPGLQHERTALARHRTVLAASGGTLLAAVAAARSGRPVVAVVSALFALVLAAAALVVHRSPREKWTPWAVLVLAAGTVVGLAALGVAGAMVSILGSAP